MIRRPQQRGRASFVVRRVSNSITFISITENVRVLQLRQELTLPRVRKLQGPRPDEEISPFSFSPGDTLKTRKNVNRAQYFSCWGACRWLPRPPRCEKMEFHNIVRHVHLCSTFLSAMLWCTPRAFGPLCSSLRRNQYQISTPTGNVPCRSSCRPFGWRKQWRPKTTPPSKQLCRQSSELWATVSVTSAFCSPP